MASKRQKAIAEFLVGTANSWGHAETAFGVKEEVIERAIIATGIECCANCGWWHAEDEINAAPNGEMICDECMREDPTCYGVDEEDMEDE